MDNGNKQVLVNRAAEEAHSFYESHHNLEDNIRKKRCRDSDDDDDYEDDDGLVSTRSEPKRKAATAVSAGTEKDNE